jgi:hypothetical protein
MALPLPFKISLAAEQHIRALLVHELPLGMEIGIVRTFGLESLSPEGELTERFIGEHFTIAGNSRENWMDARSAVRLVIVGREFWISRDSMAVLRGKTLTAKPYDVGYGRHAGKIRDLLVAA